MQMASDPSRLAAAAFAAIPAVTGIAFSKISRFPRAALR